MSFPRYPEYKDSRVEWLGEVPVHWSVSPLKRVVDTKRKITYGIVQAGADFPGGVPYIRPADMSDEGGVVSPDEMLRTTPEIAAAYRRSEIGSGDLICTIGPSFGKVMVAPEWLNGANLTQGTARVAIRNELCSRFYFWVLRSNISYAQWESQVGGATFRALNLEPLSETVVPLPSVEEQFAIANFLDSETTKIDGLIVEQEKLIALLKEKRQAVISHAVTKGLDPNVPMKDSGIEWLGEVPTNWQIKRVSWVFSMISSGTTPSSDTDKYYGGDISWVTTGELRESVIFETEKTVTNEAVTELSALRIYPVGTLLIALYGATIGRLGFLGVEAATNQACCAMVGPVGVVPRFVFYALMAAKEHLLLIASGGGQPNINQDKVRSLRIAKASCLRLLPQWRTGCSSSTRPPWSR